ncbi:hypothetical protein LTR36_006903 [Oleoguttula mirabilis]|uniref:Uncharacterized protein n=1 Tax=Oleoguttula mirabilis TaxID=1507867 RepID=A0AAV9JAS4_9PEZI|nr:hypothetical protein LTR36_006903 [Oleoguttula mirabilis]
MDSHQQVVTTGPALLTLSAELRNYIYRLALVSDEPVALMDSTWQSTTNVLRTNQQLRNEASNIFFAENIFVLVVRVCTTNKMIKSFRSLEPRYAGLIPALSVTFESCKHVGFDLYAMDVRAYNTDSLTIPMMGLTHEDARLGGTIARKLVQADIEAGRITALDFEGGNGSCMVLILGRNVVKALREELEMAAAGGK